MKNTISRFVKVAVLSVGLIIAASCNLEDHLVNPSALSPDQASTEYIFNSVQLGFAGMFITATQFGMDNTRMTNMFGSTYESAYNADNFDGLWSSAYQDILINCDLLLSKTTENLDTPDPEYIPYYQGVGRVFKAYTMMLLVDYFGDVPYSEALDANQFNPVADPGEQVYDSVKVILDEAVVHLTAAVAGSATPTQDLYYGGDAGQWLKLANTLLMKYHLQRRLVDATASTAGITAALAAGVIGANDDFFFRAPANSQSNPNTYHPWFYANYLNGAAQYMSNSYMKELFDAKESGQKDPRIRYYFFRQQDYETAEVNELQCIGTFPPNHYPVDAAFCQLPEGYWGRDHLNFEGTPPDGFKRTVYGLYPAGGKFDAFTDDGTNESAPVSDEKLASGAKGVGILPIMMHSYVLFMRAEYELTLLADEAAAGVTLDLAVDASIDYVMNFAADVVEDASVVDPGFVPSGTGVNNYKTLVQTEYAAGANFAGNGTLTPGDKLDVIVREYYIALWGNGVEAYNTVRRTGRPSTLQPALAQFPGEFYRTFSYPAAYVVRNKNAVPKLTPSGAADNTVKVFWDTNPAGFIK